MPNPIRMCMRIVLTCAVALLAGTDLFGGTVLQQSGTVEVSTSVARPGVAFGQTIKAPTNGDNFLVSFGIFLVRPPNVAAEYETAHLYAWDGSKAVGPSLFDSAPALRNTFSGSFGNVFNTGGILLTPGQEYVIFQATSPHSGYGANYVSFVTAGSGYADGHAVYVQNMPVIVNLDPKPVDWTTSTWTTGPNSPNTVANQIGFIANFTAPPPPVVTIPEPSAFLSTALGIATLLVSRRSLRNRSK